MLLNLQLLDQYYQIKIADFGTTKLLDPHMTRLKGTIQWMAPEVIKHSTYTEKADVFSYGIILHEIATRKPPYAGIDKKIVLENVSTYSDYRPKIPENVPREFAELMISCWSYNPKKRPTFDEIIDKLNEMKLK